ncbi:hypothetical protein RhiirA5_407579 [Rhizophagus irregularis]|uniref:Uncharacterized protein n=1 Tax=Rhizophagus irregularis TaxID=588596 RepID=A0A2I1ETA7_9GLOM|nr:hypothetical protein RhiirA5_407579 [Rhizophagus irregularis]PKC72986.1 hypothetical protein RhiirA1_451693 [Rhizophagus irregularis]PKY25350.1 hypothetical protein RhiirB3_440256 [Rhizophagus irregularis]CAB4480088.1 unnamed protein product [Rhizophagus irregularis]CAB5103324.1 unnamed protein product [Rhizophagus irregularis]
MKDNSLVSTSTITWKDIEKAQNKIMVHYVARYKAISIMLFPNEDSYKKRIARYSREWYENKSELLKSVENSYKLYYELSKEERTNIEEE